MIIVLKSLVNDGYLSLPDGSRLGKGGLRIADGFRMILLANRPGFPFLGNDIFSVCGEAFSVHALANPEFDSEVLLAKGVVPEVPLVVVRPVPEMPEILSESLNCLWFRWSVPSWLRLVPAGSGWLLLPWLLYIPSAHAGARVVLKRRSSTG